MQNFDRPTTVDGVRAVEMHYRPIREIATGRTTFYQSRTQLNTPELGTLMPEAFRQPAEFSGQSRKLFGLEAMQLAEAIGDLTAAERVFEWVSVHLPVRVLKDGTLPKLLEKICSQFELSPGRLCLELPANVLYEKEKAAPNAVSLLRKQGYHLMLCGFGETGTPFLELAAFPFDYVLLSPQITSSLGNSERTDSAVHSLIGYVNEMGCEPVADGVSSSTQASALYECGCNFCAGSLSGGYMPLSAFTER